MEVAQGTDNVAPVFSPRSGITSLLEDFCNEEESSKCADTCTSGSSAMQCGETSSAGTGAPLDPLGRHGSLVAAPQIHSGLDQAGAAMQFFPGTTLGFSGAGFPQQYGNGPGAGGVPTAAPPHSHPPAGAAAAAGAGNSGAPALATNPYLHRVSSGGTGSAHVQTSTNGYGFSDAAAFQRISGDSARGMYASGGSAQHAMTAGSHGWSMGAQPQAQVAGAASGSRRGRKPKPRLPDLQSQLDSLSQQFERLSSENIFLKSKLKALEKLVPNRQVSLDFLASVKSNGQQPQQQAAAAAGQAETDHGMPRPATVPSPSGNNGRGPVVADAAPKGHGPPGSSPLSSGSGASAGAAATGGLAPAGLPGGGIGESGVALPTAASTSALAEPAPGTRDDGGGAAPSQLLILELCPGPDGDIPALSPAAIEELKRTGVKEFLALWRHVTLKTSVMVAAAEALGPGSPHAARLDRYIGRMMDYMDRITLLSPQCWFQSMYINAETMEPERPTDGFWMAIGKYANFSYEQLEEIENLAKAHNASMAPVVQERARLASELSSHISTTTAGPAATESAHGISALTAVDALTDQLKRNVLREQQSHLDATDFLCWSVLTPLQVSRIISASYPYMPDGVAIMHACRALYQQAQEQRLQQKSAQALFQQQQQQQPQQQQSQ